MFLIFSKQSVFNRYLRWRNKAQVTDCSNCCNTGWQTTRRSNLNAPAYSRTIGDRTRSSARTRPGHPHLLGGELHFAHNMYVIHIVLIEISQHFANWWMKSKSLELSMHAFVALNIWLTRYILEANAYLQYGRNYKTLNNLYTLWGNTYNAAPLIQWSRNPWRDFPVQRSPLSIFEAWNLGLDAHLQCCAKYMILSYFTLCMVSFR